MSKQIHELEEAPMLGLDDRIVVSSEGDRHARQAPLAAMPYKAKGAAFVRTLQDRLGERVSVRDFGARGDGVADDAPAFRAALGAHATVTVPPGRYRLATTVTAPPRRRLKGGGRDATVIVAEASLAFVFERNRDAYAIEPSAASDWNRSAIENLTIRMTKGGVRAVGHEFRATNLAFFGGSAPDGQADLDGWCLDMVDANECLVSGVNAGYGGGAVHAMRANGVRWRAVTPGVNYGDSMVSETSIKLAASNTVGLLIDGHAADPAKVMNNMVLQRVQVNAPQNGSGIAPLAGTTGIKLWNASRVCLVDCDVEVLDTAFEEYSERIGGTSGACAANTFIGCIAHYSTRNYKDSNDLFSRSVIQRNFIGCDNVAPLPTGNFGGDGGFCQDGDAFFQGAWLFNAFGEPSIQLRSRDKDVLLLTGNHKGAAQADADGHPSQTKPYRGLLFELTSKQAAKITRPVSVGEADPDVAGQTILDARIEFGNGEGDARGELARIQINDPLYLRPRTTEPLRPYDGLIHYATGPGALPSTGEWYLGPGVYCRLNGGEYAPMATQRGAVPERERNGDFTVGAADFGKIIRVNHGQTKTVTIPAGLVAAGAGARRLWVIRQGSGGVQFAAGTGVTLRAAGDAVTIARRYQMVEVVVTGTNDAYLNHVYPDAIEPYERRLKWTAGNVTANDTYVGRLVRVSSAAAAFVEIPTGLVPATMEAISLYVMKVGAGDVEIRPGTGMTLTAPGGASSYVIAQQNKTVEVIVTSTTASSQNPQPNSIYVVG
ncbi:MAG: hypothetical protein KDG89_08355 [Geminicoccaceae bacterium]|nr:hypothetical protein [Geminicoccaceae bacterium]